MRAVRAKVTGNVLTLDEGLKDSVPPLLWVLDALPKDHEFMGLEAATRRTRTLEAVKRVLLRESRTQPLLLVFEDLHWIDAETQALLDALVESLPTTSILLAVNYRPEYQQPWGNKSYYRQLRIDALPPDTARALLEALLGDHPALHPIRRLLIERTEGNPLFLEESVRALVEMEVLVGERGAYRLGKDPGAIQIPATVQAILAARIDRLPADDKRLLQLASVIGKDLPWSLLLETSEHNGGRPAERPGPAPGGRVRLRGQALPRSRVHLQARAHPRGGLRQPAARPAPRAPRPDRRRHRARLCGSAERARRPPRPPRLPGRDVGEGPALSPGDGRRRVQAEHRRGRRDGRRGECRPPVVPRRVRSRPDAGPARADVQRQLRELRLDDPLQPSHRADPPLARRLPEGDGGAHPHRDAARRRSQAPDCSRRPACRR